ncbi:hypothetical protein E2320_023007 [Naja naja]|nr:hypothetical protein E2320_023007 [Naja naja]
MAPLSSLPPRQPGRTAWEDSGWTVPGIDTLDMLRLQFGEVSLQESPVSLKDWAGCRQRFVPSGAWDPLTSSSPVGPQGLDASRVLECYELQSRCHGIYGTRDVSRPWAVGQGSTESGGAWGPQQGKWGPPPLHASFDGNADKVAVFLGQVINHLDLYGKYYPSHWAMVVAVMGILRAKWYPKISETFIKT